MKAAESAKHARSKSGPSRIFTGFLPDSERLQLTTHEIRKRKFSSSEEMKSSGESKPKKSTPKKQKRGSKDNICSSKVLLRAKAVGAAEYIR